MLDIQLDYEFVDLKCGATLKGTATGTRSGRSKEIPQFPGVKIDCDLDEVDTIDLGHGVKIKIFWASHLFGKNGTPHLMKKKPCEFALIENCERGMWIARSDPTLDGRIGFTVANRDHRALFFGTGDIVDIDVAGTMQSFFAATFEPLYKWKSANPGGCAHCKGAVRKGGPRHGAGGLPPGGPGGTGTSTTGGTGTSTTGGSGGGGGHPPDDDDPPTHEN